MTKIAELLLIVDRPILKRRRKDRRVAELEVDFNHGVIFVEHGDSTHKSGLQFALWFDFNIVNDFFIEMSSPNELEVIMFDRIGMSGADGFEALHFDIVVIKICQITKRSENFKRFEVGGFTF